MGPLGSTRKTVSKAFPDDCGHTSMKKVLVEITSKVGDKNESQDEFRKGRFKSRSDPRDHIKKLQELQVKLEKRFQIIKTDDDIMHQTFKVLGSKCRYAIESLK